MIRHLANPLSKDYESFKELVLGGTLPWTYLKNTTPGKEKEGHENIPNYSHVFLGAPGNNPMHYSRPNSQGLDKCLGIFNEILEANKVSPKLYLRAAANAVHPTVSDLPSVPHLDHDTIPHMNIIVYLTSTHGGYLSCDGEIYHPKEDDALLFSGEHYLKPPNNGRRVCLVGTFL